MTTPDPDASTAKVHPWIESRDPPKRSPLKPALIVGGMLLAAIVGIIAIVQINTMDGSDARDACREFVLDRIKSPATAEFSDERVIGIDPGPYTVAGNVDSENSFGALLRGTYSCTVRADGDRWVLESLIGP